MNISFSMLSIPFSLAVIMSACKPSVEPAFDAEHRYRHELYSPADCARISQSNAEFNCSETIQFNPDGTANLLLNGGDIIVRSNYQRKGQVITIQSSVGLSKEVVFRFVSDNELTQIDNNTTWLKY